MHRAFGFLIAVLLFVSGCGPRVTLTRVAPAPYNLGPVRTLGLVETRGSRGPLPRFVSAFVSTVRTSGFHQLTDLRTAGGRLVTLRLGDAVPAARAFRAQWPADVYVGLDLTSCTALQRTEIYRETDRRGNTIIKTRYWAEAECEARVEMVDGRTGAELAVIEATGQHTSGKIEFWSTSVSDEALAKAAAEAAAQAVLLFTPRRVEEAIYLEKDAPAAVEGIAKIEAGQYPDARVLSEEALRTHPESATLNYNLGAVSEALGDPSAARIYYQRAIAFAPVVARYRDALRLLEQRLAEAEALRKRR